MLQQMSPDAPLPTAPVRVLLSVEEAAAALGMGRTFMYHLLARKEIVSVKVGRTRRVPVKALHDYVDRLCCARG
jgi:excisionase family DNA binding protein